MNDYATLNTKAKKQLAVGKTHKLWKEGLTNSEIAEKLKLPIETINEFVEMCKYRESLKSK